MGEMLGALADRIEGLDGPKILRFSKCDVAGKRGYRWQSVQTSDEGVMRLLCDMWNARKEIAAALRAQEAEERGR